MAELTSFETMQLEIFKKEVKRTLRLSAQRDLYNYNQASFRLNISRNRLIAEFIKTGLIKEVFIRGEYWIPRAEIEKLIEESDRFVHKDSLKQINL